jgi:hypothetical protein
MPRGKHESNVRPARVAAPGPHRLLGRVFVRHERIVVSLLLLVHAALVLWGALRSSVTYDENFHVPAGVLIVTRGDYGVSTVNPPLVKTMSGLAARLAGAELPDEARIATRDQRIVGDAFMRRNASRYRTIFFAARLPTLILSLGLAWLVWRFARRLYGAPAGLFALGLYTLTPEALAHAGVATMDIATALGFLGTLYGWWGFTRSRRWRWWGLAALWLAFTTLTRFTSWSLLLILPIVTGITWARTSPKHRRRLLTGLALLPVVALAALLAGYRGAASARPLSETDWNSSALRALSDRAPWLRLPVPDAYLDGFDWQLTESEAGVPAYVQGSVVPGPVWWYFPYAMSIKWPLAILVALALHGALAARERSVRRHDLWFLLVPVILLLGGAMFLTSLAAGVRYVLPLLPFLCVWLGGFVRTAARVPRLAFVPFLILGGLASEAASCAPHYLSFFNALAGNPKDRDRRLNDSNVDWGQGLLALRDAIEKRGIGKIYLTYHGTVDPAIYGIDYIPYTGGPVGGESEWLAVSSYYYRGLSQRMVTSSGISAPVLVDFRALEAIEPVARPAGCMLLFRLRSPNTPSRP